MEDLGSVTVSMWVAPVSFENADRFFYRDNFDVFYSASREFVKMEMRMSGSPIIIDTPQKLSPPPSPSAWKWYNFRWNGKLPDSSDSRLYYAPFAGDEPISGINRYGGSGTPLGDAGSDTILGNVPGGPPWGTPLHAPEAHFDEVRISSVVRSPHWIHIQYRSMTDALLTFDEEEAL
jgi:hypothetical protein